MKNGTQGNNNNSDNKKFNNLRNSQSKWGHEKFQQNSQNADSNNKNNKIPQYENNSGRERSSTAKQQHNHHHYQYQNSFSPPVLKSTQGNLGYMYIPIVNGAFPGHNTHYSQRNNYPLGTENNNNNYNYNNKNTNNYSQKSKSIKVSQNFDPTPKEDNKADKIFSQPTQPILSKKFTTKNNHRNPTKINREITNESTQNNIPQILVNESKEINNNSAGYDVEIDLAAEVDFWINKESSISSSEETKEFIQSIWPSEKKSTVQPITTKKFKNESEIKIKPSIDELKKELFAKQKGLWEKYGLWEKNTPVNDNNHISANSFLRHTFPQYLEKINDNQEIVENLLSPLCDSTEDNCIKELEILGSDNHSHDLVEYESESSTNRLKPKF